MIYAAAVLPGLTAVGLFIEVVYRLNWKEAPWVVLGVTGLFGTSGVVVLGIAMTMGDYGVMLPTALTLFLVALIGAGWMAWQRAHKERHPIAIELFDALLAFASSMLVISAVTSMPD